MADARKGRCLFLSEFDHDSCVLRLVVPAKMLVLRRFVLFALGRTVRPAEGHVRREARLGVRGAMPVCEAAQVGARACSGGGATCRATHHSAAAITKKGKV